MQSLRSQSPSTSSSSSSCCDPRIKMPNVRFGGGVCHKCGTEMQYKISAVGPRGVLGYAANRSLSSFFSNLYSLSNYFILLSLILSSLLLVTDGMYLPGAAPVEYENGASVMIKVNSLHSVKTQLPIGFYTMPFCQPPEITSYAENIGEILSGDLIENSAFKVKMKVDVSCETLCSLDLSKKSKKQLIDAIDDEYSVRYLADNLPAAMPVLLQSSLDPTDSHTAHVIGFPLGSVLTKAKSDPKSAKTEIVGHTLNNHVTLTLKYHAPTSSKDGSTFRVVGFDVVPKSVSHKSGSCTTSDPLVLEKTDRVTYTYDVQWEASDITWAFRWDVYFQAGRGETEIHWFSIVNSVMIVLFLTGVVAIILLRTLLRDIARYNQLDNLEEAQEESGWKLVHGDVFRKPQWSRLLAVCAGTGVQILAMTVLTMIFAVLGFLSPANRGALLQAMVLLFTFMGFPAGYVAARFARLFEGVGVDKRPKTQSLQVTSMTAFLFPGACFATFFIINALLWSQNSTGAVKFGTMFILLLLWFGISSPLVFVGAHYGLKRDAISLPVKSNPIPREIPPHSCLTNRFVVCLVGGVLPFGAVFTELLFILSSIWLHQFYYLFGFLTLVLVILLITCSEISIAFTYFQLAVEDYHWWWRSFWVSGTSGLYVFLYSVLYFFTKLDITRFVSTVLYFGYTFLLAYSFALLSGATGFITTFLFLRAIYGSIKID